MTEHERKAAVATLRVTLEAHDAAALSHLRDARKHLKRANELSAKLERLSRSQRAHREHAS
jgi:hypothetical protein